MDIIVQLRSFNGDKMPIYEYFCKECEQQMDIMQKMSDPKLTHCPNCNSTSFDKLVSAPSFKLKGTGWYETDFKNNNKQPSTKGQSSDKVSA